MIISIVVVCIICSHRITVVPVPLILLKQLLFLQLSSSEISSQNKERNHEENQTETERNVVYRIIISCPPNGTPLPGCICLLLILLFLLGQLIVSLLLVLLVCLAGVFFLVFLGIVRHISFVFHIDIGAHVHLGLDHSGLGEGLIQKNEDN